MSVPASAHFGLKTNVQDGRHIAVSDNDSGLRMFHSFTLVGDTWTFEDSSEFFGSAGTYGADFSYDSEKIYIVHASAPGTNGTVTTLGLQNGSWTTETAFDIDPSYGADYNFGYILVKDEKMFLGAYFYGLEIQRK